MTTTILGIPLVSCGGSSTVSSDTVCPVSHAELLQRRYPPRPSTAQARSEPRLTCVPATEQGVARVLRATSPVLAVLRDRLVRAELRTRAAAAVEGRLTTGEPSRFVLAATGNARRLQQKQQRDAAEGGGGGGGQTTALQLPGPHLPRPPQKRRTVWGASKRLYPGFSAAPTAGAAASPPPPPPPRRKKRRGRQATREGSPSDAAFVRRFYEEPMLQGRSKGKALWQKHVEGADVGGAVAAAPPGVRRAVTQMVAYLAQADAERRARDREALQTGQVSALDDLHRRTASASPSRARAFLTRVKMAEETTAAPASASADAPSDRRRH